jgi:hypothetical protein
MPPARDLASDSLLISCGLVLIAAFLGLRQWYESRAREADLADDDRVYFRRQDRRRALGVAIILVLAAGLSLGSRMPLKLQGQANIAFVEVWAGVIALIVVLMILAMIDLLATRRYAQRQRRSMAQERIRLIRDAIRETLVPPDRAADDDEDSR